MSDARLIKRVAGYLHSEALEDAWEEDAGNAPSHDGVKAIAKKIIAVVRRSDRRRTELAAVRKSVRRAALTLSRDKKAIRKLSKDFLKAGKHKGK